MRITHSKPQPNKEKASTNVQAVQENVKSEIKPKKTPTQEIKIIDEYMLENDDEKIIIVINRNDNKENFDKLYGNGIPSSEEKEITLPDIEKIRTEMPDYFFFSFEMDKEIVIDVKENCIASFCLDKNSKNKEEVIFVINGNTIGKVKDREYGLLDEFFIEKGICKIKAEGEDASIPIFAIRECPKQKQEDFSFNIKVKKEEEKQLFPKKYWVKKLPTKKAKILLALQYWEGDEENAYNLAKIVSDIEEEYNNEAIFMFSGRFDTRPIDQKIIKYVSKKFETIVHKGKTQKTGHPDGCNGLWLDSMKYANYLVKNKKKDIDAVFTFEPDCVPIKKDWIKNIHNEWREKQCLVLGHFVSQHKYISDHINGNMVVSPFILDMIFDKKIPEKQAWDVVLYNEFKYLCKQSNEIFSIIDIYNKPIENLGNLLNATKIHDQNNYGLNKRIKPSFIHGIKDNSGIKLIKDLLYSGKLE